MFRGHGKDSQQRQFQLVVELICQKTGGPCVYMGRPMTPVHDGLGISEANWSTFMKIISDGMDEKKYPSDIREEFLAIWRSFHDGVVQSDGHDDAGVAWRRNESSPSASHPTGSLVVDSRHQD